MSAPTNFLGAAADIATAAAQAAIAHGAMESSEQPAFVEASVREWEALIHASAALCVDDGARRAVELAAMVAACAKLIGERVDEPAMMRILHDALVAPRRAHVGEWLERRMGVAPGASAAFEPIARNFKSGGERTFGAGFIYEQETQTPQHSFINVRKCVFNDFFHLHGKPGLTKLFCALDTIWADALNDGAYDVSFERPTMMGAGDSMCRFQFTRRDAKP